MTFVPYAWKNKGEAGATKLNRQDLNAAEENLAAQVENGAIPPPATILVDTFYGSAIYASNSASLQAAFAAAMANGPTRVLFTGGKTYEVDTAPVTLNRNLSYLDICLNGATIKLTSGAPRLFDFNKRADHDSFENITIRDGSIDCNNVGGSHHVVAGTYQNGTFQSRISCRNIFLRRLKTLNVPSSATGANDRRNVCFVVSHAASNEATRDELINIVCEDCDFSKGGNYGIEVGGTCPGNQANIFYDEILFQRCKHDTGLAGSEFTTVNHANFFIGSAAFGGFVKIIDCKGTGSGDVGIEIDGATNTTVTRTSIIDANNTAFFDRNFQNPLRPNAQVRRYTDCHAIIVNVVPLATNQGPSYGWRVGHTTTPTPALGRVIIEGCTFDSKAINMSVGQAVYVGGPVARLDLREFDANCDGINQSLAANQNMVMMYITPAEGTRFTLAGTFRMNVTGAIILNGHTFKYNDVWVAGVSGSNITLDVDRHYSNNSLSGVAASSLVCVSVGPTSVLGTLPLIRGRYRYVVESYGAADTAPYGAYVQPYGTAGGTPQIVIDKQLMFFNCDASLLPAGSAGFEIYVQVNTYGDQPNTTAPLILYPGLIPANGGTMPQPSGFAPSGAGPTRITNLSGCRRKYWFSGATPLTMKYGRRTDTTAQTVTAVSDGPFDLDPGDCMEITMTSGTSYQRMPAVI
jgi:hypothetical protein